MKILIISATYQEVKPLVGKLKLKNQPEPDFRRYKYENHSVDVLITGIGSISTAYMLMKYVTAEVYNFIIQAGIAGSYNKKLHIGSVVHVLNEQFADLGVEDKNKFFTLFEKGIGSPDKLPYSGGKLVNPVSFNSEIIKDIPCVSGITVNCVSGSNETISLYRNKFKPDIESMEGAAFFYICIMENIPFIELRGISNFVEERNKRLWDVKLAVNSSNEALLEILAKIC
ncbi:MAG: futalosine hydrolase [Bacteroidales bacterium]|nr:futalosine hydrolase [Bacteroidales bacterium]